MVNEKKQEILVGLGLTNKKEQLKELTNLSSLTFFTKIKPNLHFFHLLQFQEPPPIQSFEIYGQMSPFLESKIHKDGLKLELTGDTMLNYIKRLPVTGYHTSKFCI